MSTALKRRPTILDRLDKDFIKHLEKCIGETSENIHDGKAIRAAVMTPKPAKKSNLKKRHSIRFKNINSYDDGIIPEPPTKPKQVYRKSPGRFLDNDENCYHSMDELDAPSDDDFIKSKQELINHYLSQFQKELDALSKYRNRSPNRQKNKNPLQTVLSEESNKTQTSSGISSDSPTPSGMSTDNSIFEEMPRKSCLKAQKLAHVSPAETMQTPRFQARSDTRLYKDNRLKVPEPIYKSREELKPKIKRRISIKVPKDSYEKREKSEDRVSLSSLIDSNPQKLKIDGMEIFQKKPANKREKLYQPRLENIDSQMFQKYKTKGSGLGSKSRSDTTHLKLDEHVYIREPDLFSSLPTEKKSLTLKDEKKKKGFFKFRSKKDKYISDTENKKYTNEETLRKKYTPIIRRYSQRQQQRALETKLKKQSVYNDSKPGCYKSRTDSPNTELENELSWWKNAQKAAKPAQPNVDKYIKIEEGDGSVFYVDPDTGRVLQIIDGKLQEIFVDDNINDDISPTYQSTKPRKEKLKTHHDYDGYASLTMDRRHEKQRYEKRPDYYKLPKMGKKTTSNSSGMSSYYEPDSDIYRKEHRYKYPY